jgi:hypothetical protein
MSNSHADLDKKFDKIKEIFVGKICSKCNHNPEFFKILGGGCKKTDCPCKSINGEQRTEQQQKQWKL